MEKQTIHTDCFAYNESDVTKLIGSSAGLTI